MVAAKSSVASRKKGLVGVASRILRFLLLAVTLTAGEVNHQTICYPSERHSKQTCCLPQALIWEGSKHQERDSKVKKAESLLSGRGILTSASSPVEKNQARTLALDKLLLQA